MNERDSELLEGLRALAADGPQEAPPRVEERLLAELRRRSHARRRNLWLMGGTGAIAAAIAVLLWIRPAPPRSVPAAAQVLRQAPQQQLPKVVVSAAAPAPHTARSARRAPARDAEVSMAFHPLPDTDQLPPVDSATVVRVQLPLSSLRLMGVPVNQEHADEHIQADVLLGQDGLARGVRFVQ